MIPSLNLAPGGLTPPMFRKKSTKLAYWEGALAVRKNVSLKSLLETGGGIHVLVLKIHDYALMADLYGEDLVRGMDETLSEALATVFGQIFGEASRKMSGFILDAGEYLLIWENKGASGSPVQDQLYALKALAEKELNARFLKWTGRELQLGVGFSPFHAVDIGQRERNFFRLLNKTRLDAGKRMGLKKLALTCEFKEILRRSLIQSVYQPIVDLKSGAVFGWEALSRGPENGQFRSPLVLFDVAEKLGELFALERVCREKAIMGFGPAGPAQKLFLNIHPRTLLDPGFTPGNTLRLLESSGTAPENVVFEITERHSVKDFPLFLKTLEHYRSQGFLVAVDDFGTGYSSLSSIAELRPDFIKMDMSLTRDVNANPVKQAIMETFVAFAAKIGTKIIAEGVETPAEAAALTEIGAHFGQGWHIGRPASPKTDTRYAPMTLPASRGTEKENISCSAPVSQITQKTRAVRDNTPVSMVRKIFKTNSPISSVVVIKDKTPSGLVMSYHLDKQLASQYGLSLYSHRPIHSIMDSTPLMVESDTPLEQAATQAMARSRLKAYDDIIVVKEEKFQGIVSVRSLMDTMARIQVEVAKGVNPLTGLPGNVSLEQEVERRISKNSPFDIVYADLDNFKVYNDVYGFKKGDEIIKLGAEILSWAVRKYGSGNSRLFHIGGDDFVLVTAPGTSERICQGTVRCFKRLVRYHYHDEDRERGWIRGKGRNGEEAQFPLVSVSLGILGVRGSCSLLDIGERAAHIKKYAKSLPGNTYVTDRRDPLGVTGVCECPTEPSGEDAA